MKKPLLKTELLILPDGRILVHNLTQPMTKLLRTLNSQDHQLSARGSHALRITHQSK